MARVGAAPRVTVHKSPQSGQITAVADIGVRAADLTAHLALLLPAGVRLTDAACTGERIVLTFAPGLTVA